MHELLIVVSFVVMVVTPCFVAMHSGADESDEF